MSYEILYHEAVVKKDIPPLADSIKEMIKNAIEQKLVTHPDVFGKPLRRSLKNYRKLRVGDYRVIFRIQSKQVKIMIIAHRSFVYRDIFKRGA